MTKKQEKNKPDPVSEKNQPLPLREGKTTSHDITPTDLETPVDQGKPAGEAGHEKDVATKTMPPSTPVIKKIMVLGKVFPNHSIPEDQGVNSHDIGIAPFPSGKKSKLLDEKEKDRERSNQPVE